LNRVKPVVIAISFLTSPALAQDDADLVREEDSVLLRTGSGPFHEPDRAKFMGPMPGPGEDAANWLAARRNFLTGSDQLTFEVFPLNPLRIKGATASPLNAFALLP
jgi:kynurenine formamidase